MNVLTLGCNKKNKANNNNQSDVPFFFFFFFVILCPSLFSMCLKTSRVGGSHHSTRPISAQGQKINNDFMAPFGKPSK